MEQELKTQHSPLPWRSVYPLGDKARCAAVESVDHYVVLYVAQTDTTLGTITMHQANADLIVEAVNAHADHAKRIALLEQQLAASQDAERRMREAAEMLMRYCPLSGDMALMIRGVQSGGEESFERANKLVEHYIHLDEAQDKMRAALTFSGTGTEVKADETH